MQYAYVNLSHWDFGAFRFLGPGLGNLLFPWARAVVAAEKHDLQVLWPTWPQIKIGSILRRESDLRFYSRMFRNPGTYIGGTKKIWLMSTTNKIDEQRWRMFECYENTQSDMLVTFSGMNGLFEPLLGHREKVRREIIRMSRHEHLGGLSRDFRHSITVHVRLGDFRLFDDDCMRGGNPNVRLSLPWVIETIQLLRNELGHDRQVYVFSDGNDHELEDLLTIPNVKRLNYGSALADMLAMSQSQILVVSSTFSMWAAFLGTVPSIYYPGQLRQHLIPEHQGWEIEREPDKSVGSQFLENIVRKMEMME